MDKGQFFLVGYIGCWMLWWSRTWQISLLPKCQCGSCYLQLWGAHFELFWRHSLDTWKGDQLKLRVRLCTKPYQLNKWRFTFILPVNSIISVTAHSQALFSAENGYFEKRLDHLEVFAIVLCTWEFNNLTLCLHFGLVPNYKLSHCGCSLVILYVYLPSHSSSSSTWRVRSQTNQDSGHQHCSEQIRHKRDRKHHQQSDCNVSSSSTMAETELLGYGRVRGYVEGFMFGSVVIIPYFSSLDSCCKSTCEVANIILWGGSW